MIPTVSFLGSVGAMGPFLRNRNDQRIYRQQMKKGDLVLLKVP